eukprot:COSAG02_NODE_37871_length_436_cov_0.967359_1_plen_46_part_01
MYTRTLVRTPRLARRDQTGGAPGAWQPRRRRGYDNTAACRTNTSCS